MVLILVPVIPGLYLTVLTIDAIGHRVLMWFGFIITAIFLAAAAATQNFLTDPNFPNDIQGVDSYWKVTRGGWLFLVAASFFFMAWGPYPSIYIITAELFPTRWRCTGYGFVNSFANFWGFIGVFVFLYAGQPRRKETTYSFPCDRTSEPSDFYNYWAGACKKLNNCPNGRVVPIGDALGSQCIQCIPSTLSGCNFFGLGTIGAYAIMIPMLFFGALMTQLLPITTYQSLEDVNYMNEKEGEFLEQQEQNEDDYGRKFEIQN